MKEKIVFCWSGGKDSALALWALRSEGREPLALITTVTADYGRVSMHGLRRELLRCQALAVGIPLVEVSIPAACSNELYRERLRQAFDAPPLADIAVVAHGDLFLEDVRAYREEQLAASGRSGLFPLWGRDTTRLAAQFIEAGFEATLVCIDPRKLDPAFAGRAYDDKLLSDLPAGVDPCGENGEFHTFVHAGPIFATRVRFRRGSTVERDGFVFSDLIPAD